MEGFNLSDVLKAAFKKEERTDEYVRNLTVRRNNTSIPCSIDDKRKILLDKLMVGTFPTEEAIKKYVYKNSDQKNDAKISEKFCHRILNNIRFTMCQVDPNEGYPINEEIRKMENVRPISKSNTREITNDDIYHICHDLVNLDEFY